LGKLEVQTFIIFRLFQRVITVSLETLKIVDNFFSDLQAVHCFYKHVEAQPKAFQPHLVARLISQ